MPASFTVQSYYIITTDSSFDSVHILGHLTPIVIFRGGEVTIAQCNGPHGKAWHHAKRMEKHSATYGTDLRID